MATEQQIPKLAAGFVEHQKWFKVLSVEDSQWAILNMKDAIALMCGVIKNCSQHETSVVLARWQEVFEFMVTRHESFWLVVHGPFMARDLTREDIRGVIRAGLEQTRGSYKSLTELFNMKPEDYKRFLNFLRQNECILPFKEFRTARVKHPPSQPAPVLAVVAPPKVDVPPPPKLASVTLALSEVPKPVVPKSLNEERSLELSRKVLIALFYSNNGQLSVNLSRSQLQKKLATGENLDVLVSDAIRQARDHWQMAPQGSEAKQKFIRLMHRFRHDFGDSRKLDDSLRIAMKQDNSQDPVSL